MAAAGTTGWNKCLEGVGERVGVGEGRREGRGWGREEGGWLILHLQD